MRPFLEMGGPCLGSPCNKNTSIFGSILGPCVLGNSGGANSSLLGRGVLKTSEASCTGFAAASGLIKLRGAFGDSSSRELVRIYT